MSPSYWVQKCTHSGFLGFLEPKGSGTLFIPECLLKIFMQPMCYTNDYEHNILSIPSGAYHIYYYTILPCGNIMRPLVIDPRTQYDLVRKVRKRMVIRAIWWDSLSRDISGAKHLFVSDILKIDALRQIFYV